MGHLLVSILVIALLALLFGLATTFVLRSIAPAIGLMDNPDGRRKLQARPVAVVGGVSVFIATILTLFSGAWFNIELSEAIRESVPRLAWLGLSATMTICLGFLDDRFDLRARYKLFGQIFAVVVLILGGGYLIQTVSLFGYTIEFGVFAVPVTILWFLAAMNAINLLDGMDGLLGTLGTIIVASLGFMAWYNDNIITAFMAATIVGALLGFLTFNRPPASVYMGDAGSMFLGLMIAAMSIQSSLKAPAVAILAPVALLVLPFLDTGAAIVRRKLTGRGLAISDRGHLHHVLQKNGFSVRQSLLVVGGLGLIAAGGAIGSVAIANDFLAIAAAVAVVIILLVSGWFGVAETRLVTTRVRAVLNSAITRSDSVELEVRLQGTAQWEEVWTEITTRAIVLNLTSVHLDVNAPAWHEGYHRRWSMRSQPQDQLKNWRVELPLLGHGQVIGRLVVFGDRGSDCIGEKLVALSDLAKRVEQLAVDATLPMAEESARLTRSAEMASLGHAHASQSIA